MKVGDVIFLLRRIEIEGDIDNTLGLDRNKAYTVNNLKNNRVILDGIGNDYHLDRFRLADIDGDQIQGINFFKIGDKVALTCRGRIGWEANDYTTTDGIKEEAIYKLTPGSEHVGFRGFEAGYHPNHFKKVSIESK